MKGQEIVVVVLDRTCVPLLVMRESGWCAKGLERSLWQSISTFGRFEWVYTQQKQGILERALKTISSERWLGFIPGSNINMRKKQFRLLNLLKLQWLYKKVWWLRVEFDKKGSSTTLECFTSLEQRIWLSHVSVYCQEINRVSLVNTAYHSNLL